MDHWHRSGKTWLFVSLVALGVGGALGPAVPAAGQSYLSAEAEPAQQEADAPAYRLRGSRTLFGEPGGEAADLFADGGIGEDDSPKVLEADLPVPLSDDAQARALAEPREPGVTDPINVAVPDARANVRAGPVEPGAGRREATDPFLPPGFRAGTWQVFTRLEQAIGYSTNAVFAAGGEPGAFSQTDASVTMRSDWSRHEAGIEATGSLRRALQDGEESIPSAGIAGDLRLDLIDGHSADLRANYNYTTESLSSTSLTSGVSERPGVHTYGASAELARTGGRLEFRLRGSADRTTYEDAKLAGGGTLSQTDRNNTLYQLTARTAYGRTPAIKPFLQGGVGWRIHDEETDRNGDQRDSQLYDLRAGVEVDLHEKLSGELAVGYAVEDFADDDLATLDAVTLNGRLDWSPERDTNIAFTASSGFGGSTTAGDSGSVRHDFAVEAERRVRDNLAVNGKAAYALTQYDSSGESDRDLTVGAGIEYWVSRYLSLTADVEYQRFDSATAGGSWEATSVRMGVAVQR